MLTITREARDVIRARNAAIHLDMPPVIGGGCCAPDLQECPTVRFGPPPARTRELYVERSIDGVVVFVPRRMEALPGRFTLVVTSFLGIRRVVLEGWSLL
jgi:hypothetical protein